MNDFEIVAVNDEAAFRVANRAYFQLNVFDKGTGVLLGAHPIGPTQFQIDEIQVLSEFRLAAITELGKKRNSLSSARPGAAPANPTAEFQARWTQIMEEYADVVIDELTSGSLCPSPDGRSGGLSLFRSNDGHIQRRHSAPAKTVKTEFKGPVDDCQKGSFTSTRMCPPSCGEHPSSA